jgi:hypothetical protein
MEEDQGEGPVFEVGRQQHQQAEAERRHQHAPGGEGAGAEAVGEDAGDRPDDQQAQGQRQHVDAGPQRRLGEAVAVLGQPDPLQPDDQHEEQATAGDRGEEGREGAEGEGADAEEGEPEHRRGDAALDHDEGDHRGDRGCHQGDHPRAAPTGRVAGVGTDPVGDRDHREDQAEGEGRVAEPVDRGAARLAALLQLQVAPDGAEEADRDRDQEDQAPVDRRQQAAEDEADEEAADADDVVDPQRHAALGGGEGVGDDRGRVGEQAGAADALDNAEDDQVGGAGAPRHPVDREQQRGGGVDDEAEVVDADAAVDIAEAAEADDQDAGDDQVAEDHPEQVEAVGRDERVEVDATEDAGHRDQRDRGIERRQQHRQGGVGEGDPLVGVGGVASTGTPMATCRVQRHMGKVYRQTLQFACAFSV